VLNFKDKL